MLSFETHFSSGDDDQEDIIDNVNDDKVVSTKGRQSMDDGADGIGAYVARHVKPKRTVKRRKRLSPLDVKEDEEDVHQVTAKLIRETKAELPKGVERPRTLGGFLQTFIGAKGDGGITVPATDAFAGKAWARKLSAAQLEALKRAKPKLSTNGEMDELEIVPPDAPSARQSQRVVDRRRMRAALAPKLKRASIDVLNAQLDLRIGMQKKAEASLRAFREGADMDVDDEPDYGRFKQEERRMDDEDLEEEGMGSETSASDEDGHMESDTGDLEGELMAWKAGPGAKDLGKPRPVIQCDEDAEDEEMGAAVESEEDEELMDALIQSSADEDEAQDVDSEDELKAPLDIISAPTEKPKANKAKQSSITSFLSGKFNITTQTNEAEDARTEEHANEPTDEPPMKIRSHRNVFFDEEAEDEEDDLADRADELLDEAAIEADLRASKFIAEPDDDEADNNDAPHHLDIHRALMREEDERQLDEVVQRFVRDKTMTDSLAFQSLQAKYDGGSESEEDGGDGYDAGDDVSRGKWNRLQNPVMEGKRSKRTDEPLFDLIRAEMQSSSEDEGSASYSEPDPFHDDEAIMQSLDSVEEEEENALDVENADKEPGLEDSLMGLFTSTTEPVKNLSKPKLSMKPAAAFSIDPQRKARLLATEEEDYPSATTTSSKTGAAFTRK